MYNHYEGEFTLNPKEKYIEGNVHLTKIIQDTEVKSLTFYLYKNLELKSIQSKSVTDYIVSNEIVNWSPSVLESKSIIINLNRTYQKGEKILLQFNYSGYIGIVSHWEVNRLNEEFFELGLYSPYFPLLNGISKSTFHFNVTLPEDYTLINGEKENGVWNIRVNQPDYDCTLIGSNKFKKLQYEKFLIYYIDSNREIVARKISENCHWIHNYYTGLFSTTHLSNTHSLVILPRKLGGGYSRANLTVFPDIENEKDVNLRFLAHEYAHLWWNNAINSNSWEDWLNESFAEFSALMAVREHVGIDMFNKYIKHYELQTANTKPIYMIERSDEQAYKVLYMKGPLILFKVEQKIGQNRFIELLKQVHVREIKETHQLLDLVTKLEGKDLANELETDLHTS